MEAPFLSRPLVEDRRVYERLSARFPVKIKDSRNDYGTDFFLTDISAGGLKLLSKEKLYLHDFLSLLIKLPDGQAPITLNGEVVWSKSLEPQEWEIGLRFHKIDYLRLYRFLKVQSPSENPA